jgi:hypothetical protein
MTETAPDDAFAALTLEALPFESLSPAVQKLVGSPSAAKLMAARGIAPLRPLDLVVSVYQLSFDADPSVKHAAEGAPAALPDKVLSGPLADPTLPPVVIHYFAERLSPRRIEPLEKILYNPATADETFARLARRLGERELEVIVQNETRFLRCPAIVQALFGNKHARMSSVNRAIELCARHNVRVDGIPSFDDIARSILDDPTATDPTVADLAFEAVLRAAEAVNVAEAPEETPEPVETTDGIGKDGKAAKGGEGASRKSPIIDFSRLKLFEKIRLATLGNAYCRSNLIRDSNRMVSMAVIRSPGITDNEVVRASGNRQVSEDVIRYIANQRDLVKIYQVKLNLVHNPKCPLALSLRFVGMLHAEDIKRLARSKNIPSALAAAARKLVATRGLSG